jgi:hypothetical protein
MQVTVTIGGTATVVNQGLNVYPNLRDHYCAEGFYCPEGTQQPMSCPLGTYNRVRGRKNRLECQRVQAGFYVSSLQASDVTGPCDPGYYCPEGSTSSN